MLLSFVCPPLDLVIELDEEAGTIYDLGHHGPALSMLPPADRVYRLLTTPSGRSS